MPCRPSLCQHELSTGRQCQLSGDLGFQVDEAIIEPIASHPDYSGLAIAQAGATTGQGIAAVVVFTLLACSTVLIPIVAFLFLGDRSRTPLDALKTWLLANNSTILIILFTVLAAKMLGSGLAVF